MTQIFKDLMAQIPTCVGIITYKSEDGIRGCTISSLMSVSVEEGSETVLFALRNHSRTGDAIKNERTFSISILAAGQSDIAKAAGGGLQGEALGIYLNSVIDKNIPEGLFIKNSKIKIQAKMKNVISLETTDLFLCQLVRMHLIDKEDSALIYLNRSFGRFSE